MPCVAQSVLGQLLCVVLILLKGTSTKKINFNVYSVEIDQYLFINSNPVDLNELSVDFQIVRANKSSSLRFMLVFDVSSSMRICVSLEKKESHYA